MILISVIVFMVLLYIVIRYYIKARKIHNHTPFKNIWNNTKVLGQNAGQFANDLLKKVDTVFVNLNIPYILVYGTLLGAVRNNGFIPWDDDIDIAIPKDIYDFIEKYIDSFLTNDLKLVKFNDHFYKIFPSDVPLIKGKKWGWPFVDIFFYDVKGDKTIISDVDGEKRLLTNMLNLNNTYKTINTSDLLPLKRIEFNSEYNDTPLMLSVPQNPINILDKMYKNWSSTCISSDRSHILEKEYTKQYTKKCSELEEKVGTIFDNVYVINLDRRPDRFLSSKSQLEKIGIEPIRWKAIDAQSDDFKQFYDYIPQPKRKAGELACYSSHRKLWKHLFDSNIDIAIIFEDDLAIPLNITRDTIEDEINNSKGFDILFLGHCYSSNCSKEDMTCVGYGQCLHAYIVTRNALKILLDQPVDYNKAVDHITNDLCENNELMCFVSYTSDDRQDGMVDKGIIFQQSTFKSDIQKPKFF